MKLLVLENERFTCSACGQCCRKWLPELFEGEAKRVESLIWPSGDPLAEAKNKIIQHGNKSYLGRKADGSCMFLNEANGLCRIHEQFGYDAKPLGCQIFPFQIKPTFKNEVTITGRFDCPTVRKNIGAEHAEALPQIRRWASQIDLSDSFDEATRCFLDRDQIQAVCEFISTLIGGFERDEQRAMFIAMLCDLLAQTDPHTLDRASLAQIFPQMKKQIEAASAARVKRPGIFARMAFRALLGLHLRRDEDVLVGLANRFSRFIALSKIVLGFGGFRQLGLENRPGKLRRARLFKPGPQPTDAQTFALFWRLIRIRLESFQFMGAANLHRNFLDGLRSLALLYPLVKGVAKYSAANRGSQTIELDDVDHAVTMIEHSHGRLLVLNKSSIRPIEKLLLGAEMFIRLARTV